MTAPDGWSPAGRVGSWTPGPDDWVVDPIPPAPAFGPHRPRRPLVLLGAAVLAVAATVAGIVTWQVRTSVPDSPEEVAEAYFAAHERFDWPASWELLCRRERAPYGGLAQWIRSHDLAIELVDSSDDELTYSIGDVRPSGRSSPESYVVDVELGMAGVTRQLELLVVEEDGGLRACGTP